MIPILGAGARSSVANFWPQLDNCGGGGSLRDEGVGSVNSDITEVNSVDAGSCMQELGKFKFNAKKKMKDKE